MKRIEQGDLIRIRRSSALFLVISSDYFNRAGLVVVCPIVNRAEDDALHVPVQTETVAGFVLCEQLTTVSAFERGYSTKGRIRADQLLEVIYRVQSIFDYYQHAE